MTAALTGPSRDERLDLLDGLIYADAFDCAVTLDELWRYGRIAIDPEALRRKLEDDPALRRIVVERDGFFCLADRPDLVAGRRARMQRARALQRRARRVARVLRQLPFVRALVLTGSAAADNAAEADDVDLLVVVAPDRLGITFLLLGSASRVLGRRLFCPNYYACEGRLTLPPTSVYIARELVQARDLTGAGDAIRNANPWLEPLFPNIGAARAVDSARTERPPLQRLFETPLRGRFGERLERWARRMAVRRLRIHYGELGLEVPADVAESFDAGISLRFHGRLVVEARLERYEARRAEVAARLAEADQADASVVSATR